MTSRFGPFEILRSLGAGGMAETSLAVRRGESGFEQRVCLKRILAAYGTDKEFVRGFTDEAKLAVRLEHPNICRLYDFGQIDGTYFMSMEVCEGGDLRELIRRLRSLGQPFPTDAVLLLALDMAHALHYAHSLEVDGERVDIVHRDISPSNVLIDAHGNFKLADFGIARARTNSHITQSGVVKGKTSYMSPDHMQARVDARDDLWSLGVMLYECVAGVRPFEGPTEPAIMLRVLKGERRHVRDAAPGTPEPLVLAIEHLLVTDREARTPNAAALIDELTAVAPPVSARSRLSKLMKLVHAETSEREKFTGAETDPAGLSPSTLSPVESSPVPPTPGPTTPAFAREDAKTRTARPPEPQGARTEPELTPPHLEDVAISVDRTPSRALAWGIAAALAALGALVAGVLYFASSASPPTTILTPTASSPADAALLDLGPDADVESVIAAPVVLDAGATGERVAALTAPTPDAETGTEPAAGDTGVAEDPVVVAAPSGTQRAPEPARTGTVDITAIPWGGIWIDGRRVGEGHLVRRLPPGRHELAAGSDAPYESRAITLEPGQRMRVSLRAAP